MIISTVVAIIITSGGNLQCTHGLLATVLLKLLTQTTQQARREVEIRCFQSPHQPFSPNFVSILIPEDLSSDQRMKAQYLKNNMRGQNEQTRWGSSLILVCCTLSAEQAELHTKCRTAFQTLCHYCLSMACCLLSILHVIFMLGLHIACRGWGHKFQKGLLPLLFVLLTASQQQHTK